jgi:pimeloyl-ACP methyl ester carboxylesterase
VLLRHPGRPIHVVAHSMGIEVAMEMLHHLPAGSIHRILSLAGASYRSRVAAALATPAGREAELINVTSRENDAFDFMYEWMLTPPHRGDRALGHGLTAANAVTLQLDCSATLAHLARLGAAIAPPARRICHWSCYTRPGALAFYEALLRQPQSLRLQVLKQGLPETPAPRWSRLLAPPAWPRPLPMPRKLA